jgi:hypothetical protein
VLYRAQYLVLRSAPLALYLVQYLATYRVERLDQASRWQLALRLWRQVVPS